MLSPEQLAAITPDQLPTEGPIINLGHESIDWRSGSERMEANNEQKQWLADSITDDATVYNHLYFLHCCTQFSDKELETLQETALKLDSVELDSIAGFPEASSFVSMKLGGLFECGIMQAFEYLKAHGFYGELVDEDELS